MFTAPLEQQHLDKQQCTLLVAEPMSQLITRAPRHHQLIQARLLSNMGKQEGQWLEIMLMFALN